MKKVFKLGCMGFIGLILLGVIVGMVSSGGETTESQVQPENQATENQEQPKKQEKKDENMVTLANYDKIVVGDSLTGEGGMSIEEVTAIFGADPETRSESQSGDLKMIAASWIATGWENMGDNVSVTFINGKVTSKAQFGLDE